MDNRASPVFLAIAILPFLLSGCVTPGVFDLQPSTGPKVQLEIRNSKETSHARVGFYHGRNGCPGRSDYGPLGGMDMKREYFEPSAYLFSVVTNDSSPSQVVDIPAGREFLYASVVSRAAGLASAAYCRHAIKFIPRQGHSYLLQLNNSFGICRVSTIYDTTDNEKRLEETEQWAEPEIVRRYGVLAIDNAKYIEDICK